MSGCPVKQPAEPAAGKCPVGYGKARATPPLVEAITGSAGDATKAADDALAAAPAASGAASVAGSHLNPANAMPAVAAQSPTPGQRVPLSTARVTSTIPSGTSGEPLWVYPSQQMFYNAMRRKGYDPNEQEMKAVVAIHNTVNERAWSEIVEWERALHPECADALRLLRFQGKPDEPTPKARARAAVGYAPPFDRHDWVVERCGREVRYLIDFYHGCPTPAAPVAMHLDTRPALDDAQAAWDRVRRPFHMLWEAVRPATAGGGGQDAAGAKS
jgi:cytochrome c heme-lyase